MIFDVNIITFSVFVIKVRPLGCDLKKYYSSKVLNSESNVKLPIRNGFDILEKVWFQLLKYLVWQLDDYYYLVWWLTSLNLFCQSKSFSDSSQELFHFIFLNYLSTWQLLSNQTHATCPKQNYFISVFKTKFVLKIHHFFLINLWLYL